MNDHEQKLHSMLDRAFAVIARWRALYESKSMDRTAEVESLKRQVNHYRNRVEYYRGRFMQACQRINDQRIEIEKSAIPYPKAASEMYAAQNELETLRSNCRSQREGIAILRRERDEACLERDLASRRAEAWRKERNATIEGLSQARQTINELYREMDGLRKDLKVSQAVNHIISRREMHNPRLEMILEESYRNEFKRNVDNQKSTDSPNCPSS